MRMLAQLMNTLKIPEVFQGEFYPMGIISQFKIKNKGSTFIKEKGG